MYSFKIKVYLRAAAESVREEIDRATDKLGVGRGNDSTLSRPLKKARWPRVECQKARGKKVKGNWQKGRKVA
jgi:hypothetical protein